ncbi:MAG: hypothetical protein AAF226_09015 [Verrucomicrobiota bacterium]
MPNWIKVALLIGGIIGLGLIGVVIRHFTASGSVSSLINPDTRLRSFHRLWLKTEGASSSYSEGLEHFANFDREHHEIRMVECANPEAPASPLYLIFLDWGNSSSRPTPPWAAIDTLFSPAAWSMWNPKASPKNIVPDLEQPSLTPMPVNHFVIYVVDSQGNLREKQDPIINSNNDRLFGGNNLTDEGEIYFDINNDGWVERINQSNFGSGKNDGTVISLEVTRIDSSTTSIFTVLFDVHGENGAPTWEWQLTDTDNDGVHDIQLGPIGETFQPQATFSWSETAQTYISPEGEKGDHFEVFQGDWKQIDRLLDQGGFKPPVTSAE